MLRISALNDQSNSKDDQINIQLTKTKEAKEAEAFVAYNKALSYQHRGNSLHAERLLRNLFDHPLLKDAAYHVADDTQLQKNHSGLQLLYSIHKNLASILLQRNQYQEAMTAYIEAVKIDSSEVTVWFQMGQVARKLDNYPLAKICFQQALQCNPNHWPSLDNAITLNYALGDYILCLQNISFALEKDCNYTKALALKSQIYSEQPSLKDFTRELFHFCNATVNTAIVDHNETQEYIDEALQIRSRRRQLADEAKEKELGSLTFLKPLIPFSWKNLGEQLIDLYDFVTSSHPPKSLALEVDFRDYFFLDQAVFLRQFEKQTKQLDVISNNKECIIEPTLHKTQQETPLINLGVNVSNSHTTVINTKETALLKRLHGILDVEGPVIKKKNTDLILDKEDGFKDLEPVDISGTFELPLLREEDMDIDTLNLADIPKSSLKSDDDIAPQDLRSLENVLASVIEMEFEVQKEHNIEHMMKSSTNPIEAEVTNQDVQCSFLTSTERATSLKGNDFLEIQQFQQQKIKTDESKMVLLSGNKTTSVVNESDSLQISAAHNESDLTIKHSLTQKPSLNFPSVLCSKPDSYTSPQQNTDSVNFNITDSAKTNTYNEFFIPTTLQQSFDILSENCLELEFLDGLKSTTDTVIEKKTKVDSQPKIILTPSGVNVCPAELAHSPITTSLFSPDISCPKSAFVYHSVLSSIKQNELIGTDKNEYYSPIKSFKTNCSKSSNRKEQPHLDSLIHGNNSLPNERKLCDTIENLTQNQLLLENIDERSKISLAFTGQTSPSSQLNDSLMNSSISLGQNSVPSASYFLRHESSSLSSHFIQAGTFSDGVNNSASLSLPSHHLNMLTALESEILLKSSKDHNNTDVTEWPNARLTGRHSLTKPQSLYQLSYFPKYQPKHHSHLLLSTSVRSPLLSKGYQLPFEASGSVIYPSISPPKMFPGSALIPCSHLYLDDISSAINTNFLLSSTLSPYPSQFLNNTTSHFNSTKTSFNNSVYHETVPPNSAFKISPGKADQCHQHSPKSQSLSHSQHHDLKSHLKYPQFASVQPQYLEPQSPSSSSTITSHQDHNYQKKGLLCQEKKESSDSATLVSTQVLPPKLLESLTANEIRTPIDHVSKSSGVKRGPKRKIEDSSLLEWTNAYKRRSTRSRSIKNQKEGKTINYKNLMKSYIPSSLLNVNSELNFENDDVLTVDIDKVDSEQDTNLYKLSVKKLNENEETDVKTFIKNSLKSNGVIDLIYKYLLHLANKFDIVWYEGIVEIYLKLYKRLRNHLSVPTLFDDIELLPADGLKNYAAIILVSSELNLNQAVIKFDLKNVSPSKAAHHSHSLLKLGDFHSDMAFLASLIGRNDALGSWLGHFSVRYYWMKAKEHHLLGQTLDAVRCYEIALEFLQDMETVCRRKDVGAIVLPNIQDYKISSTEAKRLLEALQRSKSLEDNQKLYDEGHYDLVIENLVSAFKKRKIPKSLLELERPSQLLLLINSLYHSHKHVEGIKWAEVSVDEAVLCHKRVPSIQLHQEWAATLVALFSCIDRLLEENCSILSSLSRNCLYRLANNLTSIIDISLDVADTVTEMPIPSLLPWKIFYRVLHYEEQCYMKAHVNDYKETNEDDVFEEEMSRSLTMLTEAHEYLGRHSWCTKDNGLLLLYTISVLAKDLEDKEIEDIHFEQCVYCLYGHPTKKGKARHLSDHNATPIKLSWEKAGILFKYFVPRQVPEFDSYKIKSVSSDVENLLRRIYVLVPDDLNPAPYLQSVTDYICGISDAPKSSPFIINNIKDTYKICSQLYYLLGDFYFKNKEPAKAVKFYQLDLVINSNRLDSWAGLALAKMYQIEQKLNSTELKIETTVHKKSEAALRCFRRALELQKGSRKLWLEYGSLAYQLHSHASRQIKFKELLSISSEITENSKKLQNESLLLAKQNYIQARECQGDDTEEDWLTHYMLGKIAEKEQNSPDIYLEHYKQAAICLYNEKASYPKKIQFASIPPPMALEALEVFYRLHVSALKIALHNPSNEHLQLIFTYVQESLLSPFAKCEEKNMTVNQERGEICMSANPALTQAIQKHICHKNPLDHDYSMHNNVNDTQFDKINSSQYEETPATSKILQDLNVEYTETKHSNLFDDLSVKSLDAPHFVQIPTIHPSVPCQFDNLYRENAFRFQAEKYTTNSFCTNTDNLCDKKVCSTLKDTCDLNVKCNMNATLNFFEASGDLDKSVGTLHTSLGLDEVVSAQTLRCDMIDNKKQKNSAHQQLQTQISINEEDMCSINDAGDMKAGNIQVTEKLIVDQSLDMIIPKTQGTTSVEKKQFDTRFSPTSGILNLSPLKEVAAHNCNSNKDMQYAELILDGSVIESQEIIQFEEPNFKKSNEIDYEEKEPIFLKTEIITKCVRALELCVERYSAHYKSVYRLAEIYYVSKNLNKARDILLGRPDWQDKHYMLAPGLFAERKQSNFFQGLWKIPLEDIDRPGCFATHVHRSVVLLLKVLTDLGDIETLKTLRAQLKRTPDVGKKYLRDAERLALAEVAFSKCVEVVNRKMDTGDKWSERQREDNLANVYQVWLMGKGTNCLKESTSALHRAFKIMMKGRTDVNRLTEDQAIMYCHSNLSKATPSIASSALQSRQVNDKNRISTPSAMMKEKDIAVKVKEKEQEIVQNTDTDKIIAEDSRNAAMNSSHESNTSTKLDNMPTDTDNLTEIFQFTSLRNTSIMNNQTTDSCILFTKTLNEEKRFDSNCLIDILDNSQNIMTNTNISNDESMDNIDVASKNEATFSTLSNSVKALEDEDVIIISESD